MSQWKDEPPPPQRCQSVYRRVNCAWKRHHWCAVQGASSPVPSNCSAQTLGWHLPMQLKCQTLYELLQVVSRMPGRVSLQAAWTLGQEMSRGNHNRGTSGLRVTSSQHFKGEFSTLRGRCVSTYTGNPNTHILGQGSIKEGGQGTSGSRDLGGGHCNWLSLLL